MNRTNDKSGSRLTSDQWINIKRETNFNNASGRASKLNKLHIPPTRKLFSYSPNYAISYLMVFTTCAPFGNIFATSKTAQTMRELNLRIPSLYTKPPRRSSKSQPITRRKYIKGQFNFLPGKDAAAAMRRPPYRTHGECLAGRIILFASYRSLFISGHPFTRDRSPVSPTTRRR